MFATVAAGAKQARALPWRCDKRRRVIVAETAAPDGTPLQAETTVRTPSCDRRFTVSLDPRTAFRAGRTVRVTRARRLAGREDAGARVPARPRELDLPQPPGARTVRLRAPPHRRRDRHALRHRLPRQRAARGPRREAARAGHGRLDDPDRRRLPQGGPRRPRERQERRADLDRDLEDADARLGRPGPPPGDAPAAGHGDVHRRQRRLRDRRRGVLRRRLGEGLHRPREADDGLLPARRRGRACTG